MPSISPGRVRSSPDLEPIPGRRRFRRAGAQRQGEERYASDPHWKDLVLFHEYFHGDNGRGVGASQQTGWTSLVLRCIEDTARRRAASAQASKPKASRPLGGSEP